MKRVWTYFAIGCVLAFIGLYFSDICGDFFNGMDYGSACVLGMGMYLCVMIFTCTGIIVSKITSKSNEEDRYTIGDDDTPYFYDYTILKTEEQFEVLEEGDSSESDK